MASMTARLGPSGVVLESHPCKNNFLFFWRVRRVLSSIKKLDDALCDGGGYYLFYILRDICGVG
jgi:hypothetical protein